MSNILDYLYTALLQFSPVGIVLVCLAYKRQSLSPIVGGCWLLLFFLFDMSLSVYLKVILKSYFQWNFAGKVFEFIWPLIAIYVFKIFSPEKVGLSWPKKNNDLALGLYMGLVFALFFYGMEYLFANNYPLAWSAETLLFEFTLPGLSEELLYRGFFLAVLNKYLLDSTTDEMKPYWGIILTSILFITLHMMPYDYRVMWVEASAKELYLTAVSITVATVLFAYLRIKTNSIWPGVICHNISNGVYFLLRMVF